PNSSFLPKDTQLSSTNSDVAEVSREPIPGCTIGACLLFKSFGSTTLQLRRHGRLLASYVLVFTPVPPGKTCINATSVPAVVDCSGKCVLADDVWQKLREKFDESDRSCDDGSQGIDLSCSFISEFFFPFVPPELLPFTNSLVREGGNCSP